VSREGREEEDGAMGGGKKGEELGPELMGAGWVMAYAKLLTWVLLPF
jgi:hypothetical protein